MWMGHTPIHRQNWYHQCVGSTPYTAFSTKGTRKPGHRSRTVSFVRLSVESVLRYCCGCRFPSIGEDMRDTVVVVASAVFLPCAPSWEFFDLEHWDTVDGDPGAVRTASVSASVAMVVLLPPLSTLAGPVVVCRLLSAVRLSSVVLELMSDGRICSVFTWVRVVALRFVFSGGSPHSYSPPLSYDSCALA
uniref:Uncharacterized protein n=2 Tax=Lygus hesperus TaxID=30085 RepID=A0A0A9XKW3_LYGHE